MKFLSICSGIEAASVAWNPLGWEAVGFSEIEPFPCAVLKHHFPNVKNYGDMTRYESWNIAPGTVDLVCGGTPCQSFSVAGKRGGLDDARGNLMLVYLKILNAVRPRWMVWENVPGVLSSNGGRDFAEFLGTLTGRRVEVPKDGWKNSGIVGGIESAYGAAYRVLDAQYFGVPQRRRRVFVVGHLGDWRPAAAVLFERHSLQGHHPPSRKAGKDTAGSTGDGVDRCLTAGEAKRRDWETCNLVAHTLRGAGHDASEDGTGRGTPLVAVAVRTANTGANGHGIADGVSHALDGANGQAVAVARGFQWQSGFGDAGSEEISGTVVKNQTPAVALDPVIFQTRISRNGRGQPDEVCPALTSSDGGPHADSKPHLATGSTVRRLTPRECERLQGFPDDWTRIPWRGKPEAECPDGPRYKAIGNSWAVPCARWIGERIEMVEKIL